MGGRAGGWLSVGEVDLHESARCISPSVHTLGANDLVMSVDISFTEQLLIFSLSPRASGFMCSYTSYLFSVFCFCVNELLSLSCA